MTPVDNAMSTAVKVTWPGAPTPALTDKSFTATFTKTTPSKTTTYCKKSDSASTPTVWEPDVLKIVFADD